MPDHQAEVVNGKVRGEMDSLQQPSDRPDTTFPATSASASTMKATDEEESGRKSPFAEELTERLNEVSEGTQPKRKYWTSPKPQGDDHFRPDGRHNIDPVIRKHNPVEEMNRHLPFRLSNEFPPIRDPDFDTAVYLGIPPRVPDQDKEDYDRIFKHFNTIHLVSSGVLKDLKSAKINDLFRPNVCIRTEKKFKKLDAYNSLSAATRAQIKYHINLQPPEEGDEAASLMMGLSCAWGLRIWHLAQSQYDLSPATVAGVDEFDTASNPYYSTLATAMKGPQEVKVPIPADFCPIRQRSSLERLLNAAHAINPKLDSACKMWTYFATIQHFGCADLLFVNWYIVDWLNSPGNSQFVQNNPEVAYRIAFSCRKGDLVRDAFAMLVGERALADILSQSQGQMMSSSHSVHGRPYEVLDDDERSRIGHAASSLVAGIKNLFNGVAVAVDWLDQSPEFRKLVDCKSINPEVAHLITTTQEAIAGYVRFRILQHLVMRLKATHEDLYGAEEGTVLPHAKHPIRFKTTYNDLPWQAKIFTRSFWFGLCTIDFEDATSSSTLFDGWGSWYHLTREQKADPVLSHLGQKETFPRDMIRKVQMVNEALSSFKTAEAPTNRSSHDFRFGQFSSPQLHPHNIKDDSSDTSALNKRSQPDSTIHSSSAEKRRKTIENDPAIAIPFRPAQSSARKANDTPYPRYSKDMSEEAGRVLKSKWASPSTFLTSTTLRARKPFEADVKSAWNNHEAFSTGSYTAPPPPKGSPFPAPSGASGSSQQALRATLDDGSDTLPFFTPDPIDNEMFDGPGPAIDEDEDAHSIRSSSAVHNAPLTTPADKLNWKQKMSAQSLVQHINPTQMLREFSQIVHTKAQEIVYPPHLFHGRNSVPVNLIDFVIALTDEEWKFLPLWVEGGCDDGTGGVFDDAVPNMDGSEGFRGGKRGMHIKTVGVDGIEENGSITDDSDISEIESRDALSSRARASHAATDGTRTVVSMSDGASDSGFMNQDDVYAVIQEMKAQQAVAAYETATGGDADDAAANGDGDVSTIMGARSVNEKGDDVQGEFFGSDAGDEDMGVEEESGFEDDDDFLSVDKGKGRADDTSLSASPENPHGLRAFGVMDFVDGIPLGKGIGGRWDSLAPDKGKGRDEHAPPLATSASRPDRTVPDRVSYEIEGADDDDTKIKMKDDSGSDEDMEVIDMHSL
ncbi:uncharacterized protein AB675_12000 [Cyphellophora attinorum]|uniref:Uncharacterized protein n=1 Tax=Cyphellophora attinorum TaxID=1664694 RepID=A0A0N1H700_9EURO|nr:uncharacterized protein AB675_12000 [Phialophora attinorum]KPI38247.1 hypothetical protein AB675_12000 [Phialophora attinorum]